MRQPPYILAVAGGSGSGKTSLAESLVARLQAYQPVLLCQDFYYRDRSDLTLDQRRTINYDHPDAIEFSLLITHLRALKKGENIQHPLYDFSQHNRRREVVSVSSSALIVLDGILLLAVPELLPLLDFKIFIDTPLDICFIRRLERDIQTRGRTLASVIEQYLTTVRPMYLQHVYPSRVYADLVVSGEEDLSVTVERIVSAFSL